MLIFILANLPLPLIVFLNWRVTTKFLRVHRLAKHAQVRKPRRLVVGWLLSNLAIIFVLIPPLTEHRLFVEDFRWLMSYATSAILTIGGLLLMNSALRQELRELSVDPQPRPVPKPVDTAGSDTL